LHKEKLSVHRNVVKLGTIGKRQVSMKFKSAFTKSTKYPDNLVFGKQFNH